MATSGFTSKSFGSSLLGALVGAAIVAASLNLTGSLTVHGSASLGDDVGDQATVNGILVQQNSPSSGIGFISAGVINENNWTTLVQAANQDVTNLQNQDSNTFTFAVTNGNTYTIECLLIASGTNSANDFEFRFAVSAGNMTGRGQGIT